MADLASLIADLESEDYDEVFLHTVELAEGGEHHSTHGTLSSRRPHIIDSFSQSIVSPEKQVRNMIDILKCLKIFKLKNNSSRVNLRIDPNT